MDYQDTLHFLYNQLPMFQRVGDDLVCELQVPMTAAALGTTVTIDTLDGPRDIQIQAGTPSGTVVILGGLGVGRLHRGGRGDLKVSVAVRTPTKLDEAQRALLEQFAKLRGEEAPTARLVEQNSGIFSKLRDKFAGK